MKINEWWKWKLKQVVVVFNKRAKQTQCPGLGFFGTQEAKQLFFQNHGFLG